jgi:hypothetical protein
LITLKIFCKPALNETIIKARQRKKHRDARDRVGKKREKETRREENKVV